MSIFSKVYSLCLLAILACGVFACGGGGANNDQGASFLALGFFLVDVDDETGAIVATEDPSSAAILPLRSDTVDPFLFGNEGHVLLVGMGIQNRMTRQFIRVDRIDCNYEVQGSDPSLVIPSESISSSTVLGPQSASAGTGTDSVTPQVVYTLFDIVTTDIFAFLNANKNLLPELPFNMTATCTAVGVTQSGKVLTTNPINYEIILVEERNGIRAPGPGVGLGSGGDFTSFGGDSSSSSSSSSTESSSIEQTGAGIAN